MTTGHAAARISAHGIGGAHDLPISLNLAIGGAVAALVVSFAVLALAWRTPRYADGSGADGEDGRGRPAPRWVAAVADSVALTWLARAFGLFFLAYTVMVAVFAEDVLTNPIFGIFYVFLWVGPVPLSLLLGPFYRAISPVRTINLGLAKVAGSDPDRGLLDYPERLGHWPAAFGLLAFVWMELVYTHGTELGPVRLWLAAYVALMLVGGALFGNTVYERADPFEVYSTLVGHLSIWGRRHDGTLVVRSPLANLATVPVRPGLVAVVAVLFGSTAFDAFKDSIRWIKFIQSNGFVDAHSWAPGLVSNLALVGFCLVAGLVFAVGTMATGVAAGTRRLELPDRFAHSIVPIVVGYVTAHYLTFLILIGPATLRELSDPFTNGSNWFGTADFPISYYFSYHPTQLAVVKVLAVVLGHVVGVVAAHDRAIALLPRRHQITGQLPLLVAMVAFTVSGIYLLFAA